jgi:hypothetical protein
MCKGNALVFAKALLIFSSNVPISWCYWYTKCRVANITFGFMKTVEHFLEVLSEIAFGFFCKCIADFSCKSFPSAGVSYSRSVGISAP